MCTRGHYVPLPANTLQPIVHIFYNRDILAISSCKLNMDTHLFMNTEYIILYFLILPPSTLYGTMDNFSVLSSGPTSQQ